MSCAETGAGGCTKRDLVASKLAWMVWGVPIALVAVGALWGAARVLLWAPSLVVMGAACVANAARCGRLHCYLTGPLFLLGAVATILDSLEVVRIGSEWILGGLVMGSALGFGLEWARGRYVGRDSPAGRFAA